MKMSAEMLERQKQALLKEKERLDATIAKLNKYPDYGDIGDDITQELVDFENNLSVQDQLVRSLKKVNRALQAIEAGTYGQCKKCREAIEAGRLKIMPYAELCVTCQAKK